MLLRPARRAGWPVLRGSPWGAAVNYYTTRRVVTRPPWSQGAALLVGGFVLVEQQYAPVKIRKGKGTVATSKVNELKQKVLGHLADGLTVREAMAKVDRAEETYKWWRKQDQDFCVAVDRLRAKKLGKDVSVPIGEFAEFRDKYLGMKTFPHQHQWIDVIENRVPTDLDPAVVYSQGRGTRIVINTPPFHAKSATLTIDYTVYRICKDPNVKIILISESRDMSRKMLVAIKERLTNPKYDKMHQDFGPAGGFKVGAASWTQDLIYVGNRDSAEKDPTVEVLGVGSQIYGARADLIIMDDCVTLKTARTAGQTEKIMQYIDQEVSSRLGPQGILLMVGTRVSQGDVYSRFIRRDDDKGDEARRVWTYFAQPAVLEYADQPEDWRVLWDYLWSGPSLSIRRDEIDSTTWNLVYQQVQVAEDATFPEEAVMGCRVVGTVGAVTDRIRPGGMSGLYIVVGLDPAGAGHTALVVLGVDRKTKRRYLIDCINQRGMTPLQLRDQVSRICKLYTPKEWRIEKNGLQTHISQDPELRQIIMGSGGRIVEHHTHSNKWDPSFGVMSLAPLFLGALETPKNPGIIIPDNGHHKGVLSLLDQLITWEPDTKGKTDLVMALWFADLGCRKWVQAANLSTHRENRYATRSQVQRRQVINLEEYYESVGSAQDYTIY